MPGVQGPECPGELILYWELREYNAMPVEGSYLDQPWTLMQDLRQVRKAIQHKENSRVAKEESKKSYS